VFSKFDHAHHEMIQTLSDLGLMDGAAPAPNADEKPVEGSDATAKSASDDSDATPSGESDSDSSTDSTSETVEKTADDRIAELEKANRELTARLEELARSPRSEKPALIEKGVEDEQEDPAELIAKALSEMNPRERLRAAFYVRTRGQ
jgi:hypothetical protein